MKRLVTYFLQGVLLLVPTAATLYVLFAIFRWIDGWLPAPVPGLGALILIAGTTIAGFLASTLFAGTLQNAIDSVFRRLPLARLVYGAVKDLLGAFVGEQKRFDAPVLVDLVPDGALRAVGFVTQPSLDGLGFPGTVAVYFPQSYNFSGLLAVVAKERVHPLALESADAMAFVVSGGVSFAARETERA
ncbi:MAG: DUF502 domain-containing protein [Deltaproteobacteria bacterium]|nr:DUF502 domain-containing protein [Deltaproteobacteria bacterium]